MPRSLRDITVILAHKRGKGKAVLSVCQEIVTNTKGFAFLILVLIRLRAFGVGGNVELQTAPQ